MESNKFNSMISHPYSEKRKVPLPPQMFELP